MGDEEIQFDTSDSPKHSLTFGRNLQRGTAALQFHTKKCPHRLEAQDTALSRRRQGFESPWGYFCNYRIRRVSKSVGVFAMVFRSLPYCSYIL